MTGAALQAPPQESGSGPLPFKQQVRKATEHLAKLQERKKRGPLAELRKLSPDRNRIPPQVFWEMVKECQIRPPDEDHWLTILPLMVRHPHTPGIELGRALAGANVSAARVERWLRLNQQSARREAGRLLSHLKGEGFDWSRFAPLLRFWTEDARRGFARDFFLSAEYRQRQTQGDDA